MTKLKEIEGIIKSNTKGSIDFYPELTVVTQKLAFALLKWHKAEVKELKRSKKVAEQGFRDQYDLHLQLHKKIKKLKSKHLAEKEQRG